ncbi:MAG: hypothetical protein ACRC0K_03025 [Fusobacteriaceae bacterium]
MKKQEEKLTINSLDEFQELIPKYKGKSLKIFVEKGIFIGESKEFFDEEIYNEFEYVIDFEERYFFALSREIIEEILEKCSEEKIKLEGIYLIEEFSPEIINKNFLREEYKQEKKEIIFKKEEKIVTVIIFGILLIIFIFSQIIKINIGKKVQLEKKQLNYTYEVINKLEEMFLKNSLENSLEKNEFENLNFSDNKKVDAILNDIERALEKINIESIEINDNKIKIKGSAKKLEEIYKFEKNLYENFENINNDFIKKENLYFKFIFDFTIKE